MIKKLPIGTKITYKGNQHTILAYNYDSVLLDNCKGGHYGSANTWYDENGKQIPYVEGDHRYWLCVKDLNTFSVVSNKEPEFIFEI